MNLGPGNEFDRLRGMLARIAEISGANAADIGDDCALLPLGSTTLAISLDNSLENVHFRTDWLDFNEIGFRAAGAALSDLAAEGATPLGLMVSLGVPPNETDGTDPAADIMAGVATMAHNLKSQVLGGDLTRSDKYMIDVCVIGTVERPVRRSGAREGDALWVTGYLGGAALALERLREGKRMATALRNRYACPEPRIEAGRWLAGHGASAMIDISDGLVADAQHLAAASEVGIEINLEQIPCWEDVAAMAAVASGEEFELLCTMPPTFGDASVSEFRAQTGLQLTRIGACLRGAGGRRGGVRLLDGSNPVALPAGYDHFA
ncbi:MAG: thiamine-phosphate kinase [Acidobacteria bacterium 13_1_40CM_3_65_5]|nr:MAG: thiamine-phosphate kinase [Gemmatimonadetes bacterium 13_1_40CM_66_11]OLD21071.1 MAG: thiamine-phosphate kinase [Acidobacteria bacterium 13_1_40CM_3_65_5]